MGVGAAIEATQGGQAGVGTGEDIDPGGGERGFDPVALGGIVQRGGVEAPAGERLGVAMDDADHQVADAIAAQHGQ